MIFMVPRSRYLAEDDTTFNNIKGQKQQQTCVCNVLMKYKFVVYTASIILRSIVCRLQFSESFVWIVRENVTKIRFPKFKEAFLVHHQEKGFPKLTDHIGSLSGDLCVCVCNAYNVCVCVCVCGEGGGGGRGVHLLYYIQKISTYTVTAESTFACFTYSPGFGANNVPLTLFTG